MNVQLKKLSEYDEMEEFWRGARLRLMNNQRDMHPNDQYFDYMLVLLPWDKDRMILVNITEDNHYTGAVYSGTVPINSSSAKAVVNIKGLKDTFGTDFNYLYKIL